jgi:hypothetical protein
VENLFQQEYRVWFLRRGVKKNGKKQALAHEIRAIKGSLLIPNADNVEEVSNTEFLHVLYTNLDFFVKNRIYNLNYQHGIHVTVRDENVNHGPQERRIQVGPGNEVYEWYPGSKTPEGETFPGKQGLPVGGVVMVGVNKPDIGAITFMGWTMFGPVEDSHHLRLTVKSLEHLVSEAQKSNIEIRFTVVPNVPDQIPQVSFQMSTYSIDTNAPTGITPDQMLKSLLEKEKIFPILISTNNTKILIKNDGTFENVLNNVHNIYYFKNALKYFVDALLNPRTSEVLKHQIANLYFNRNSTDYYLPEKPRYLWQLVRNDNSGEHEIQFNNDYSHDFDRYSGISNNTRALEMFNTLIDYMYPFERYRVNLIWNSIKIDIKTNLYVTFFNENHQVGQDVDMYVPHVKVATNFVTYLITFLQKSGFDIQLDEKNYGIVKAFGNNIQFPKPTFNVDDETKKWDDGLKTNVITLLKTCLIKSEKYHEVIHPVTNFRVIVQNGEKNNFKIVIDILDITVSIWEMDVMKKSFRLPIPHSDHETVIFQDIVMDLLNIEEDVKLVLQPDGPEVLGFRSGGSWGIAARAFAFVAASAAVAASLVPRFAG